MSTQPTPRKHRNQALDDAMFLVGCYVAGTGLGLAAVLIVILVMWATR